MNIIEELFQKLGNSKLSAAESVTGGAFASAITSVAGASKHFKGSVVTYTNDIKQSILGVNTSNGVVNNFTAEAMAKSVKDKFGTNVSISFTGNAGPTAMDDVPVGVVFVGICVGDKSWTLKMTTQTQEREKIIMEAVAFGVVNLIKKLK